jgi:phage-related protein
MTLKTFDPPVAPSPGTTFKPTLKILEAEFGDGYTQPTPNGLNHIRETVELSWDGLLDWQMREIRDFLIEHKGTVPFYYTPVGDCEPRKWTCREWERSAKAPWTLKASLVENFSAVE